MSNTPLASDLAYSLIKSLRLNSVAGGIVLNHGQFERLVLRLTSIMEIARDTEEDAMMMAMELNKALADPIVPNGPKPGPVSPPEQQSAEILPIRRKRSRIIVSRSDGGDAA